MTPIAVSCQPASDGWTCAVIVGDDPAATRHQVDVATVDLERFAPGADDPGDLVRAAFTFLLTREPREAILSQFELTVIGRYFPGWEEEIRGTLGGD